MSLSIWLIVCILCEFFARSQSQYQIPNESMSITNGNQSSIQDSIKLSYKTHLMTQLFEKLRNPNNDDVVIFANNSQLLKNVSQLFRQNFTNAFGNKNGSGGGDIGDNPVELDTFFSQFMKNVSLRQLPQAEHAQSFYPTCDIFRTNERMTGGGLPAEALRLYFPLEPKPPLSIHSTIYMANLRLTVVPHHLHERFDVKDFRVTVFILMSTSSGNKSVNSTSFKHKKRLSDSRMIELNENDKYYDFNVKKAIPDWLNGRNDGLSVEVEDSDGNLVNATDIFMPLDCSQFTDSLSAQQLKKIKAFPRFIKNTIVNPNGELEQLTESSIYYGLPILDLCYSTHPAEGKHSPFCQMQQQLF